MKRPRPHVVLLAGPNGAGKSTTAPLLLRGALGVAEFVNADVIAHGLSAFHPEQEALNAGRLMLARLRELAESRVDFAFETTLASRSFAPWIGQLLTRGYVFHLLFLWVPNPAFAVQRVAQRVQMGGHNVPPDVIDRRYHAGLRNFFALYVPLATTWRVYNNSIAGGPALIARSRPGGKTAIMNHALWNDLVRTYGRSTPKT